MIKLTDIEARVIGSLIEKSMATPDLYPLSLPALANACSQISNRDPVMQLDEATVARCIAVLQEKGFVERRSQPGSRTTKFIHHAELLVRGGTAKETALLCVLLLRGSQTLNEIKTRTERLFAFESLSELETVLQSLVNQQVDPWVALIPRQPGQREARYMHLFSEAQAAGAAPPVTVTPARPAPTTKGLPPVDRLQQLEKRIESLEADVRDLKNKSFNPSET